MTIIRKLGKSEQLLANLNQQACTWNIVIVARIIGTVKYDLLVKAFHYLLQRHTILSSTIVQHESGLSFDLNKKIPTVPIHVISDLKDKLWEEAVNVELNTPISHDSCLLRTLLFHPLDESDVTYLIATIHHSVSDGQSSIQLISDLLNYYNQISLDKVIIPEVLAALPPAENLLPKFAKGFRGFINSNFLLSRIIIQKLFNRPINIRFEKYVPVLQRKSKVIHTKLNSITTTKFISLCKNENTTVHAAICAAMVRSAAYRLNRSKTVTTNISCKSSVNMRRRFEPKLGNSYMGSMASLVLNFLSVNTSNSFWTISRSIKQSITSSLSRGDDFLMLKLTKFFYNYLRFFPKEVTSTVHVSNLGNLTIPNSYGSLELDEISFCTPNRLYAGSFTVEVTTFQNQIFLNFVFVEPLISQSSVELLVKDTISQILDVCDI